MMTEEELRLMKELIDQKISAINNPSEEYFPLVKNYN
jgi:hypothetical protein